MKKMRNLKHVKIYGIEPGQEGMVDDDMPEVKGCIENVEKKTITRKKKEDMEDD